MKILIIQTAWIGDNILTTPLVESCATVGSVDILTTPVSRDVFVGNPNAGEIIIYDKHGAEKGLRGFLRKVAEVHTHEYDVALLAQKWWRSALLARFAKIPVRIGFDDSPAKILYTQTVQYDKNASEVVRLLALGEKIDAVAQSRYPKIYFDDENIANARAFLGGMAEFVVLAPSSSWNTKRYPFFMELAKLFSQKGYAVVAIGSESDRRLCDETVASLPGGKVFAGMPLKDVAALVSLSKVAVTNDSGAAHIASAAGAKTLTIFGPTTPEMGFAPAGQLVATIDTPLSCRPCGAHGGKKCPLSHHECMRAIEPERILDKALQI
jgi:heptosyltransferase II